MYYFSMNFYLFLWLIFWVRRGINPVSSLIVSFNSPLSPSFECSTNSSASLFIFWPIYHLLVAVVAGTHGTPVILDILSPSIVSLELLQIFVNGFVFYIFFFFALLFVVSGYLILVYSQWFKYFTKLIFFVQPFYEFQVLKYFLLVYVWCIF